jgi:hypothetical protein
MVQNSYYIAFILGACIFVAFGCSALLREICTLKGWIKSPDRKTAALILSWAIFTALIAWLEIAYGGLLA